MTGEFTAEAQRAQRNISFFKKYKKLGELCVSAVKKEKP
jgi:hypothetical protein